MGTYAELLSPEKLAAQMIVSDKDCADIARGVNALHGTPSHPQVVSRQFVSKLKNGNVKRCRPALAEAICSVLGIATSVLFDMREVTHLTPHTVARRGTKAPAA
jgi:hypothetical protein